MTTPIVRANSEILCDGARNVSTEIRNMLSLLARPGPAGHSQTGRSECGSHVRDCRWAIVAAARNHEDALHEMHTQRTHCTPPR